MKKSEQKKALNLNKVTISSLESRDLGHLFGGIALPPNTKISCDCTPTDVNKQ